MTPDVICVWPTALDYPAFREQIRKNRQCFAKAIVAFSESNRHLDFQDFIKKAMKNDQIIFLYTNYAGGQDWRDVAVNEALKRSDNERVLFLEQDFLGKEVFWQSLASKSADVIGFTDETIRFHPAFLLVKRTLIEKTSKDFSAKYPCDHFGKFSSELSSLHPTVEKLHRRHWWHYSGITYNYFLIMEGKTPTHKVGEFLEYNQRAINAKVEQDQRFLELAQKVNECFG